MSEEITIRIVVENGAVTATPVEPPPRDVPRHPLCNHREAEEDIFILVDGEWRQAHDLHGCGRTFRVRPKKIRNRFDWKRMRKRGDRMYVPAMDGRTPREAATYMLERAVAWAEANTDPVLGFAIADDIADEEAPRYFIVRT
ncbi:MAG: hypothetical protein ACYST3_09690 [Planctomycetota bacterium]|jgi:hypothetical protein